MGTKGPPRGGVSIWCLMGALVRVLREYPSQYPREESSQPAKWLGRGVGCDWGVSLEVVPELGLISWW